MAQIMALVREAAGLSGGFPTRNQLPGKTHDKTKKNQTNSTPPIRLGVSMGTMQGPTRVRPTAMSVEKIKKKSADSDRSERPAGTTLRSFRNLDDSLQRARCESCATAQGGGHARRV